LNIEEIAYFYFSNFLMLMNHYKQTIILFTFMLFVLMLSTCDMENTPPGNNWDTEINFSWKFAKGDQSEAVNLDFDDSSWENVDLPHDWAIYGPFGDPTEAGNTGKLPWKGEGWYRKTFDLPVEAEGKRLQFLFDGVMANPDVYLNGQLVGSWIYGYNSFWIDATEAANFGSENVLTVHADTREHYSRWYPGAGLYRKVSMRIVEPVHIPVWGIYITTPEVSEQRASVNAAIEVASFSSVDKDIMIGIKVLDPSGKEIMMMDKKVDTKAGDIIKVNFNYDISDPEFWDIDHPDMYTLVVSLFEGNKEIHKESSTFGIRTFEWTADDGFHLNGRRVQLYGVNMHHDQGPLGAAFYPRAMERQLEIMKEMGVNALRTSHNACAPEVLDLCDRMGIIVFDELFDKYGPTAGVQCTTGEYVDNYAEAEVKNFVLRDRNHPSVFLWSIGNEIGEILTDKDGRAAEHVANMVEYFKQYDDTRPTTMGCHVPSASEDGRQILDALETSGWNYGRRYNTTRKAYPQMPIIYSESASAFGTRGAYKLSQTKSKTDWKNDGDISSYMLTAAPWSDIPEHEFEYMRIDSFVAGEFVWTGFDYLGEPTPYMHGEQFAQTEEGHVARSSYFYIVDLAGFPKDSYYNYRSLWHQRDNTVYLTLHLKWEGHEGEHIPVVLYTNGDEAELFLNGESMGRRKKIDPDQVRTSMKIAEGIDYSVTENNKEDPYFEIVDAYRLRWMEVPYEAGEIKAVAYKDGQVIGESVVETAGEPDNLKLSPDRSSMKADGMDLCYITVEMVDAEGRVCPLAMDNLEFSVEGSAKMMGVANGDAMGHDVFTDNTHPLFYGKAIVVLRSIPGKSGEATMKVIAEDGKGAEVTVLFQ
jgi:beta-galactosidase